ncbi:MAG: hypothetical protein JSU63_16030 [Phycisphaerales bacterium]|nr:MAG: hypothetical protein JSU63_16030 [Phycisphaerales bacterium]
MSERVEHTVQSLLAVDLGIRTGLALYERTGRMVWYRSQNFGSAARLRRGVHGLLEELPDLAWLIIEGGGPLADIWEREASQRHIRVRQIGAEEWRDTLFYPRQQRSGPKAKQSAKEIARQVIEWSEAPRPTSLRHDAAEAILIGLWGVIEIGWLKDPPDGLRH